MASSIPTEEQIVHAMEEWDEGAAYRKVRHAANVGGCYSNSAICLAGETFCNRQLTDDLVANRLAYGEFTAAELNPRELGAPSVCEHVSVAMLNRLLTGMRGTFTSDDAWHFMDYHTVDCDAETLRLVASRTTFTAEERREFFRLSDEWTGQPVPEQTDATPEPAQAPKKTHGCLKVLGVLGIIVCVLLYMVLILAVGMPGIILAVITVLLLLLFWAIDSSEKAKSGYRRESNEPNEPEFIDPLTGIMMVSDSIKQSELEKKRNARDIIHESDYPYDYEDTSNEKFPDYRSSFQRRAWAEDHDWDADGGNEHNYDAGG